MVQMHYRPLMINYKYLQHLCDHVDIYPNLKKIKKQGVMSILFVMALIALDCLTITTYFPEPVSHRHPK